MRAARRAADDDREAGVSGDGPTLDWVRAVAALLAAGADMETVARWAGAPDGAGDEVTVTAPDAVPGALDVLVSGEGGRPDAVSAAYVEGEGPLLDDAILALGAWHEFTREPPGPYQGAFTGSAPRGWEVVGTLPDPPGAAGRRLVEVALVRD